METRSQRIHQKANNMTGCNIDATITVIFSFIYEEKINFACICNYLSVAAKSYFRHIKLELNSVTDHILIWFFLNETMFATHYLISERHIYNRGCLRLWQILWLLQTILCLLLEEGLVCMRGKDENNSNEMMLDFNQWEIFMSPANYYYVKCISFSLFIIWGHSSYSGSFLSCLV